ncbi:MAG: hypothetical protein M3X11_05325 [Acidobacteriota bacterium]|nr:hypothetical protein [Acidobacteriota bacterium]
MLKNICRECGNEVEYLHQVVPGRAEKSFGIYVAQLAGLPKPIIHRARQLLDEHAAANNNHDRQRKGRYTLAVNDSRFSTLLESLARLDINQLSPVEALTKLYELQKQIAEIK